MTKKEEIKDFNERVEMLKIVFPDQPKVTYLNEDNAEKNKLCVLDKGNVMKLKSFREILIVGNSVINVAGNSVSKNLEIVVAASRGLSYNGFLGYLM